MAQAAFEFSPLPQAPTLPDRTRAAANGSTRPVHDQTAFEIGWDHAHHRLTPPLRHLDDHSPVRQGWAAGRAAFGQRTLRPTAAVRQWLGLRLQAWQGGQAFEDQQVNPSFLARIDADHCPVTRQALTLCAGRDTDLQFARLNPAAAYAAGNLAALSQRVLEAMAGLPAADHTTVLARSQQAVDDAAHLPAGSDAGHRLSGLDAAAVPADPGKPAPPAGAQATAAALSPDEWARLAVLTSFATPLPHAQAAQLPLRVLPPNRVRVINPVQAVQLMFTLQFTQAGYARRLLALAALLPGAELRQAFQVFMHTLLARRLSAGVAADALALRRAMEDSWADVLVNRRWQRLASRWTAADCEQLLQRASQRGLVVGGGRWLTAEAATEGWALPTPISAPGAAARGTAVRRAASPLAAQAGRATGATSPGKARSVGSQKLTS